jgi:hypothetical protein
MCAQVGARCSSAKFLRYSGQINSRYLLVELMLINSLIRERVISNRSCASSACGCGGYALSAHPLNFFSTHALRAVNQRAMRGLRSRCDMPHEAPGAYASLGAVRCLGRTDAADLGVLARGLCPHRVRLWGTALRAGCTVCGSPSFTKALCAGESARPARAVRQVSHPTTRRPGRQPKPVRLYLLGCTDAADLGVDLRFARMTPGVGRPAYSRFRRPRSNLPRSRGA